MVSDEPRLPGVHAAGWLWHGFIYCRRETAHARPVDLSSSYRIKSARPERSVRDARHVDLNPSSPYVLVRSLGRYEDPLSGTDFLVAAWPWRRLAA